MDKDYLKLLLGYKYYTSTELRYDNSEGFCLTNRELDDFKKYKQDLLDNQDPNFYNIDLKPFNKHSLFYVESQELLSLNSDYFKLVLSELKDEETLTNKRYLEEILLSRVYSEIEGTLSIENVPTTRMRIEQIIKGDDIKDKNDQIIKNMTNAIEYILKKPEFNKDNLHKLYEMLSDKCLEESQVLKDYYRDAPVYIDRYDCAPVEAIDECMNSLFSFINKNINNREISFLLPHIAHYYIVYIHPYFDYNGRTARMVSLWISLLTDYNISNPIYLSEAINDNKKLYYNALRETRDMNNDVSYFLIYILKISIKYLFIYKNMAHIEDNMLQKGISLSSSEKNYLKKILVHSLNAYFDYKHFMLYANITVTKQAALKMLNKFETYGILSSIINDKKVKLYKFDKALLKYTIPTV